MLSRVAGSREKALVIRERIQIELERTASLIN
jgi:hypothetical protein